MSDQRLKTDQELAEDIRRAVAALNDAVEAALAAGCNVEASWRSLNWGRVTRFDVDSIRVTPIASVSVRPRARGQLIRVGA